MKLYWSYGDGIKLVELTRGVDFMCGCIYGLTWSCTIAYTILHGHGTRVSFLKSFKNHKRLSRIHWNGTSVIQIRPRLVRLYVRYTV